MRELVSSRLVTRTHSHREITLAGALDPIGFWPHADTIGALGWPGDRGGPRFPLLQRARLGGAGSLAAMATSVYLDRLDRVRTAMADEGVDVLLLSVGHDLPYLTGYEAMPLERLTMLVVPGDGDATMVIPRLEAPRVVERPACSRCTRGTRPRTRWRSSPGCGRSLDRRVGDQMWARFLVELLPQLRRRVPFRRRRRRSAADGQGRRRDRRAARRRRRRRPRRRPAPRRPDPARRADRGAGVRRHLGAARSPRATTRSTSPSSPPARTRPARTTTPATG